MALDLTHLRTQIDAIDTQLHDLLIERSQLVAEIAQAKKEEAAHSQSPNAESDHKVSHVRPEREMDILRTVLNRHTGPLSPVVVARIWREMVTAMAQLQGTFTVVVAAPTKSVGYWDLARDYFGSGTPLSLTTSPTDAMRQVMAGVTNFAALPAPNWRDTAPWWPSLLTKAGNGLHIVGRLPVVANEKGALETLSSVVLAHSQEVPQNPDVHYLSVTSASRQSPHDMIEAFKEVGVSANLLSIGRSQTPGPQWVHLMEITGDLSDAHIETVLKNSEGALVETARLGGYLLRPLIS